MPESKKLLSKLMEMCQKYTRAGIDTAYWPNLEQLEHEKLK